MKLVQKIGWAILITRKDGSTFLACPAQGNLSPVWTRKNRHWAVLNKALLKNNGFNAKVVAVAYAEPKQITP